MKKNKTPHEMIMKMKDPLQIFDMVCAANYFAGNFNQPMPVDNSSRCEQTVKSLLILQKSPPTDRQTDKGEV
jgi:hypothetical protein